MTPAALDTTRGLLVLRIAFNVGRRRSRARGLECWDLMYISSKSKTRHLKFVIVSLADLRSAFLETVFERSRNMALRWVSRASILEDDIDEVEEVVEAASESRGRVCKATASLALKAWRSGSDDRFDKDLEDVSASEFADGFSEFDSSL